jgi:diaminohydroxyphosphoribosylaminopyrimidine deaminase / 5-amino-6-(5-phosphoribosylamino)uracil reductase
MLQRGLYSIAGDFCASRICSRPPAKYHATWQAAAIQVLSMADGPLARLVNQAEAADGLEHGCSWKVIPEAFRSAESPLPQPWQDIFGPLRQGTVDDLVLVGQCGQSIDARIATPSGASHYINGDGGLDHLHRLRALVDAVVIGVGTAIADNPQLTVRRVLGPNPARVIIDPNARLPLNARVLAADGTRRLVVRATSSSTRLPAGVEIIALTPDNGRLAPAAIVCALAERGFRRILIEGGAETMSRFLAAHCLDRLHILIAPIILGAGRPSLTLPPLQRIVDAARMPMRPYILESNVLDANVLGAKVVGANKLCSNNIGADVLLDCDLSAQRAPIGRAKMST